MTSEEAIKRLKGARSTVQPFGYVDEAIDYAIKALETYDNLFKSYETLTREVTENGDIKNATKRIDNWCIEQLRGIISDYYADLIISESKVKRPAR